ncbi:glycoside hydrolase family 10 protein [Gelatoporia subvermispora B]|uniref:Beta-xylanase n=1 Tax=Ceriporiopsis subvermispora (strain B) TaxID=914234 RepID=M2QYI8_CERS8|nr:glycoside hydrolase family 10 protein [Gelatoporia subvermispora B]
MKASASLACLLATVPFSMAQSSVWGQCGGIGWTGPTTCASGNICIEYSSYYSQCIPNDQAPSTIPTTPASPPTTSVSIPGGSPTPASGLNAAAKVAGKLYFGSATDNSELTDNAYVTILDNKNEFGQITPANSMKWDATEPERGTFTFNSGDQIANLAKSNGQLLRGHNCVWYNQLPSWVTSTSWSKSDLLSVVQTHCSTIVSHYKGQVWDVINEPFNDDGTYRTDVFYTVTGTDYISTALQAARTADPNAKLYINDYNIESTGAKATSMMNLVKSLKSAGVPLDGVGLQCHFIVGEVPTSLQSIMQQFTALGVEVAITELDIRMTLPETQALLTQQQKDYQSVVAACMAVEGCVGITVWDYTDKYSWVPSTFSGQGDACPWDSNLQKKPAYNGIMAAL